MCSVRGTSSPTSLPPSVPAPPPLQVTLKVDISPKAVAGRHVLLVEDIVDTGLTLTRLREHMLKVGGRDGVDRVGAFMEVGTPSSSVEAGACV